MLRPFLMLALLITAAPALALDAAAPPAAAKAKDPKRKICEPVEETGSRLSSKRICLTAEQWEAQRGGKSAAKRPVKSSGNGGGR
ncbi:MAG TPA: hypothetical protein VFU20_07425 [Sphingomicrobium sp.]|nr:hypothetical protein [Sphingomicrobium sp.]